MLHRIFIIFIFASILISCAEGTEANEPAMPYEAHISGTLPVLYIDTENKKPIVSKTEYIDATYWLDPVGNDMDPIGTEIDPLPLQIRGRGHSSWKGNKKPYKIKLGKKTEILGMPRNKHWALLKPTENTIAGLQLGKLMGMAWTPSFRPVEVVLNGDYIGLYFLTETIRIDKNRVNIYEQKDGETNPDLIKGGWLVEVDNYSDECQITIPENNKWNLTLRYHSPEDLSEDQKQWLTNEFKAINAAIYSTDKTSTGWEEFIDVESMARFFILQEIMDNPDGFHGSFYLHKNLNDNARWIAGPIWDLVCYNREKTDYTFRMKVHYGFIPHWIGEIIKYDSFCRAVKNTWAEVYPDRLSEIYDYIDDMILPLDEAWKNDCIRWSEDPKQTVQVRADRIKNALRRNIEWFNNHIPASHYSSVPRPTESHIRNTTKVFNIQGAPIGEFNSQTEAVTHLEKGIYIINGEKIAIR